MPGIISHWLMGQRMLRHPRFTQRFPTIDREAFLWGCQGPDVLFFHRLMPWQTGDSLRPYGSMLHGGNPTALLTSLAKVCRYCQGRPDFNAVYSYALGFCCHYCCDRKLHPLVYYNCELLAKTDEHGGNAAYHANVECNLDIMLLRHDTGKLMHDMRLTECLPDCQGIDEVLATVYSLLLCDFCGIHTPRQAAMTLAADFRSSTALLEDPHAIKRSAAEAAEQILPRLTHRVRYGMFSGRFHPQTEDTGFDYGNMLGSVWFNPADHTERSHLNFYELTDLAISDSLDLTELFADEVHTKGSANLALFTRGINFSGRRCEDALS